jgi:selenocysteine lyase/cysteine desulfurase
MALRTMYARHRLLAVTGASNVTGELWPIAELTRLAHRYDARIVVDAAQLAPHRAVDMASLDVDYIALSGHKLYAPFGAGALVGRRDWLDAARPYLAGGGAVERVTLTDVEWAAHAPARHEAGTPNVVGAATMGAACRALQRAGMVRVARHEKQLIQAATNALSAIPGIEILSMWGAGSDKVGIVAFKLKGWDPGKVAAVLSAEHGIGVRAGAFCAHPLLDALVEKGHAPSAVRASIGVGTTMADVDRLIAALSELVSQGPRWAYRIEQGQYAPTPDPRPLPELHGDLPLRRWALPSAPGCRADTAPA